MIFYIDIECTLFGTNVPNKRFEDEFYMKSQIEVLKESLELFIAKYNPKAIPKEDKK